MKRRFHKGVTTIPINSIHFSIRIKQNMREQDYNPVHLLLDNILINSISTNDSEGVYTNVLWSPKEAYPFHFITLSQLKSDINNSTNVQLFELGDRKSKSNITNRGHILGGIIQF